VELVLFDIDGTLIDCGGQARRAFAAALVEVVGAAGAIDDYDFSGKPDPRIVYDLLAGLGYSREEVLVQVPKVRDAYLGRLEGLLDGARMRVLPGVRELLDALSARRDVALGLLTGNWEQGARIKLSRFDMNRYFPFGGFGDESFDRHELPPVAMERARAVHSRAFSPAETVIVGDALLDISCAHAHGIACLAVATGRTPAPALAAARPDWLLDDLSGAVGHEAFARS
jgi:phosphoglycolate phosphatase